jgi:Mycotoxin biosynthesis protein UstYa
VGWLEVSQEKVDLMVQPSVEFRDGNGYFFGVDIFHQLHCLNYLRKKTVLYNHLYLSEGEVEDEQVPPGFHIRMWQLSTRVLASDKLTGAPCGI